MFDVSVCLFDSILGSTYMSHTSTSVSASWVCYYISSLFPKSYSLSPAPLTPPALSLKPVFMLSSPPSLLSASAQKSLVALVLPYPLRSLLCFFSLIGLYIFGSDGSQTLRVYCRQQCAETHKMALEYEFACVFKRSEGGQYQTV